jgi:Methylamine utilisation protein MauE
VGLIALALRLGPAAVLGVAAVLKLARPGRSAAALAPFGLAGRTASGVVWATAAVELALAAGVAVGSDAAAYAAAGLLVLFAVALAAAMRSGRAGLPCPCFGAGSRIGWPAVARNVLLAAAFLAVPSVPDVSLSTDTWLAIGLVVALVAVAVLAVAVMALAREIGMLRLRLPPESALEVLSEGPEVGERTRVIERFDRERGVRVALAVFSSEGCRLCQGLRPAVAVLERDAGLDVRIFDERVDADVWAELAVPGSPYAVALGLDGTVLAKGTFNSFAQLESVIGAAETRAREAARA